MAIFGSLSHSRILIVLFRAVVLTNCAALCFGHFNEDHDASDRVSSSWCPNAFFNFGDSLSDTGNLMLATPGTEIGEKLPYGEVFFGKPTGRCTNGRLVIDFILMSFKLPLLDPFLLPIPNGKHGLNFAFAGATATQTGWHPFNLHYQVDQFLKVKNSVLQMQPEQSLAKNLNQVDEAIFDTALYTVCIGGNDLINAIFSGMKSEAIIKNLIPSILHDMEVAMQTLYVQGARKFLVFNGPPKGCTSNFLATFNGLPTDNLGCLEAVNEVDHAMNSEHFKSVQRLRASLPKATIIYFDYSAANMEMASNPSKYGLDPQLTHRACCGAPGVGDFNVNAYIKCGHPEAQECDNPEQYIYWDGLHFTESFYRQIAEFVLNGEFSDPPVNLTSLCNLSFEDFGDTTYEGLYPSRHSLVSDV